jgi:predicted transcriptional regulator
MNRTAVLMSIKPHYADLIFSGSKTVELRRVCPKVNEGDLVLIYASGPRMALMGGFEVAEVVCLSLNEMFNTYHDSLGITREAFDLYFKGLDKAYGILIGKTWSFHKQTKLTTLRRKVKGFHPPQSYRYLRNGEFETLSPIDIS